MFKNTTAVRRSTRANRTRLGELCDLLLSDRALPAALGYGWGTLWYDAGGGEANDVTISGSGGSFSIADAGVSSISIDPSSTSYFTGSGNSWTFSGPSVTSVSVDTKDLDDS